MALTKKTLKLLLQAVKFILIVSSTVTLMAGSLILGIGIYGFLTFTDFESLFHEVNVKLIDSLLVTTGLLLAMTATTGYCLACYVRTNLAIIHFGLLISTFAAVLSGGIILLLKEHYLVNSLESGLFSAIQIRQAIVEEGRSSLIDKAQIEFKCCGVYSPNDWYTYLPLSHGHQQLPLSCCPGLGGCKTESDYYQQGCLNSIFGAAQEGSRLFPDYQNVQWLVFGSLILAANQLVSAFLTISVHRMVKKLRYMPFSTMY